jgi:hypothetical protein
LAPSPGFGRMGTDWTPSSMDAAEPVLSRIGGLDDLHIRLERLDGNAGRSADPQGHRPPVGAPPSSWMTGGLGGA